VLIIGIDLAWGEKKADGVCFIEAHRNGSRVAGYAYPKGDDALLESIAPAIGREHKVLVTIDAPIICPNATGTRPVDRLTHTLFHREHAACHPANSTKCPRPQRILGKLKDFGVQPGWRDRHGKKLAAEVYPHPAMVRLFRIPRIIKYKKGPVAARRAEFGRLQRLLKTCLRRRFPSLALDPESRSLLNATWNKSVEDRLDAFFCAMIGLWHWQYRGKRSEIIGDMHTGFILLPSACPDRDI
jgi:predicted RNase H-like nuclease